MPFEPHDFNHSGELPEELRHGQARRNESETRFQDLWMTAWERFRGQIKWSVWEIVYEQSEDIMQQAYMKMHQSWKEGNFPADLQIFQIRKWLLRTAKNLAIDEVRRQKNQPISIDAGRENQDDEVIEVDLADHKTKDLETALCNKSLCHEILSGLSGQQRRLLELRYWGMLTNSEIAKLQNKTPSQINVEFYRAIKKAQEIMHKIEGDPSQ